MPACGPAKRLRSIGRDIRDQTILVERAVSLDEGKDTNTTAHRAVRLLAPLATDLREWRLRRGRPGDRELIFPAGRGDGLDPCRLPVLAAPGVRRGADRRGHRVRPAPTTSHSFACLLLHEERSVIYVARQLSHDARLTLTTYGHVMDEFEDAPGLDAVTAISAARTELAARLGDRRG